MSNNSNESRAIQNDNVQPLGEDDPALSESGTHPVALRPSYRPVARSVDEETPLIPEDAATTRVRAVISDLFAVVDKCASRLRGRW
jgi:hypothetical protein